MFRKDKSSLKGLNNFIIAYHNKMAESAYLTDIIEKNEETKLRQYVDRLENKIGYAKWKQSLVLNYNYMPLQNIKEKIEGERRNYVKKM